LSQEIEMPKKTCNLVFKWSYNAEYLAPEGYESSPSIFVWTSFNDCITEKPVVLESENLLSPWENFSIEASEDVYSPDSTIYFGCFVLINNQDEDPAASKAGSGGLLLKDIQDAFNKTKGDYIEFKLDMVMKTYVENDEPLKKGELMIRIEKSRNGFIEKWKFEELFVYHNVKENLQFRQKIVAVNVERELIYQKQQFFEPLLEEVTQLNANFFVSEVGIHSGNLYWTDWNRLEPDEAYYENTYKLVLERHCMTQDKFIDMANTQFGSQANGISTDFIQCLRMMVEGLAMAPVAAPYVGDYAYKAGRKNNKPVKYDPQKDEKMKVMIESFADVFARKGLGGGDCEDKANAIIMAALKLRTGISSLKDETNLPTKLGSWKSPLLKTLQKMISLYISCGTLGTVTSSFLGNSKEGKHASPSIKSNEFINAEIGGHMWTQFIPKSFFADSLQNGETKHVEILKKHFEWESELPVLLGEGTGALCPYFLPWSDTVKNSQDKKYMENLQKISTEAKKRLLVNTKVLVANSNLEINQSMLEDVDDNTFTTFYRAVTQIYTPDFLAYGYNICQFVPVTKVDRFSSNLEPSKPKLGALVKDIFKKERFFGLYVVPGFTDHERIINTVDGNHMMPRNRLIFEQEETLPKRFQAIKNKISSRLGEKHVEHLSEPDKTTTEVVNLNMTVEKLEKMSKEKFEAMVDELKNNKHLLQVETRLESFHKHCYQMRISALIDVKTPLEPHETPNLHSLTTERRLISQKMNGHKNRFKKTVL
jgi:hypothetical protein